MRATMLVLSVLLGPVTAAAQVTYDSYSFSGGGAIESSTLRAEVTIAEVFAGQIGGGGGLTAQAGFWYVARGPVPTPIETSEGLPETLFLAPNYPNPFNPQTMIRYVVPAAVHVRLRVYDVLGREVARLVDQPQAAGAYEAIFEAYDLPSGLYLYRLDDGAATRTGTMTLLR